MLSFGAVAGVGERTRLACWRWRPASANFNASRPWLITAGKADFGEAPKPAREARALPRTSGYLHRSFHLFKSAGHALGQSYCLITTNARA